MVRMLGLFSFMDSEEVGHLGFQGGACGLGSRVGLTCFGLPSARGFFPKDSNIPFIKEFLKSY